MKRMSVLLLLLLAVGCASDRYRPTYLDNGSGYGIYGQSYPTVRYLYGYDSMFLYGMYPWWTSSFYSPWFYPYRYTYYHPFYDPYYGRYFFAGWSPSWPYYDGFYGRYGWASVPYRQPPVVRPGDTSPPGTGVPGGPAGRDLVTGVERRGAYGARGYGRRYPSDNYPAGKYPAGKYPPAGYPAPGRPDAFGRPSMPPGTTAPSERVVAPVGKTSPYGSARPGYPDLKSRSVIPDVSAPPGQQIGPRLGPNAGPNAGPSVGPSFGPADRGRIDPPASDGPKSRRDR